MKTLYLEIILLLLLPFYLSGQLYPLQPQTDQILFKVVSEEGKLGIQYDTLPKVAGFPEIQSIAIEDADLVLHYRYHGLNKKYTRDVVKILTLQALADDAITPEDRDLRQVEQTTTAKKGMKGSIRWLNAEEEILTFAESYILTIERNIILDIDCEAGRPEFKFKEQWPNYAIAAGAAVSIGLGQVYRKKKEEEFDLYKNAWRNGEKGEKAESYYNSAEDYDQKARILTYAGWGILAADVIWFYYKRKNKKRKQKLYDEFCIGQSGTTLEVNPMLNVNPQSSSPGDQGTGLQFVLRF